MNDRILSVIFASIDELNSTNPREEHLDKNQNTVLFGDGGKLDSLGLVTFILTVENKIEEAFGKRITLASEVAFSKRETPFASVDSLAEYINLLINKSSEV